jgi:hypothetical protein
MAKSKKNIAVAALKKEITKQKTKVRKVMRKANAQQRKKMLLVIKRLDKAYYAISMVFDDKGCSSGFDDNCTFND